MADAVIEADNALWANSYATMGGSTSGYNMVNVKHAYRKETLLPVREALFKFVTRMDRRIVDDNDCLFRDRLTKRIKTGKHHACVYGFFKHIGMHMVASITASATFGHSA